MKLSNRTAPHLLVLLVAASWADCLRPRATNSFPKPTSTVLIIGSSVARGVGAPARHGWVYMLGQALAEHSLSMNNMAVPGFTTNLTKRMLPFLLRAQRPRVVVIGLSLANEKLDDTKSLGEADALAHRYEAELLALADKVAASASRPRVLIGGLYPCGCYQRPFQVAALRSADERLKRQRNYRYIDFLSATDNGRGQWRDGEFYDELHPNSAGHRAMFSAVNLSWFFK